MTEESDFLRALEVNRGDCEAAAQFLYAYLAIHETARRSQRVLGLMNRHPTFWNTATRALQDSAFIALGRLFDTHSAHNINALIRRAQEHRSVFSKSALAVRKQAGAPAPPPWLDDFMQGVVDPTVHSFRALRKEVAKYRAIYEARYDVIRNKVVAHSEIVDAESVAALFAKTNSRELERLVVFPLSVHAAFWQLYYNGGPLVLRRLRHSASHMTRTISSASRGRVQEFVVRDTVEALREAARPNNRMEQARWLMRAAADA